MKITDNGNYTQVELETPSGQANYLASLKADIPGDHRTWVRDQETIELGKFMQDNSKTTQIVVKTGDVFNRLR